MGGAELDKGFDVALRGFAADVQGQGVRAGFVDFVFLRVARLAAAVEDVVELLARGQVEDARQRLRP